jgi:hypothetical protein
MNCKIVKCGDKFYIRRGIFNYDYLNNELNHNWNFWWMSKRGIKERAYFNSLEAAEEHWKEYKKKLELSKKEDECVVVKRLK